MGYKKVSLPLKVFYISLIIGLVFIGIGIIKHVSAINTNHYRKQVATKRVEKDIYSSKKRIKKIDEELTDLKDSYDSKKNECDSYSSVDITYCPKCETCYKELNKISDKIDDLKYEKKELSNENNNIKYTKVDSMSYIAYYIIGLSIIIVVGTSVYFINRI